jgi:hypothetical protein
LIVPQTSSFVNPHIFRIFILNWQLQFGNPFYYRPTVSPSNPAIQDTNDKRRATASAKRAGTLNQIPKKINFFYNFLTLYPTTTYLFSVTSETSVANVFFVPNAQFRPIVEGTLFCPPFLG